MAIKVWNCTALTGGGTGAIDAIPSASLADGHRVMTYYNNKFYYHYYNASSTAAENSPTTIRPDDYTSSGVWENADSPFGTQKLSIQTGQYLTGGISGLECSTTSTANEVSVTAGSCFDATNSTELTASASQTVTISSGVSTVYHLFLCNDGVVREDTDIDAATLLAGSVTHVRWIFMVENDSSGVMEKFYHDHDRIIFEKPGGIVVATNPSTTPFTPTYTGAAATDRCINVELWGVATSASTFDFYHCPDGTNKEDGVSITGSSTKGARSNWMNIPKSSYIAGAASYNTGTVGVKAMRIWR